MGKFQQPNMANLMKQAQKMQQEMQKMQEEILNMTFDATSGGGAVKVTAGGDKRIKSLEIDPELLNADDAEILADMIIVAVNEAIEKSDCEAQNKMGSINGGMGFPGF